MLVGKIGDFIECWKEGGGVGVGRDQPALPHLVLFLR